MTPRRLLGVVVTLISLLQASGQLMSCSDVGCPGGDETFKKCVMENTQYAAIGVANFSSALSPNLLSWTVAYSNADLDIDYNRRVYYLGTSPGLDLKARTDVIGCALFFNGIESGLTFVPFDGGFHDRATTIGTCADAMGKSCPAALTQQAQDLIKNMTASGASFSCSDLAEQLKFSPPRACTGAPYWANITTKVITGPDSPNTVTLGDCNPTLNKTYQMRNVASFAQLFRQDFFNAVTPLMTVFVPQSNNSRPSPGSTPGLSAAEIHLNCMKPVSNPKKNQLPPNVGSAVSTTVRDAGMAAMIGVMVFMVFAV